MRTEVIKADTIDAAVEKILVELAADATSTRENAVYFDGWDGLGASSVLKAVAERLAISNQASTRPTGLEFEKIIYIDCSKWVSRRAMQREIAEQLKLPTQAMDMFDKQDEEDDFNGLEQGSRCEITQVTRVIYQTLQNCRFLVILHNGSNEEIDIFKFGLYIYGYANSKMLWTFQGRFRLDLKMIDNVKSTSTDVLLSASRDERDPHELWSYLVHQEAAQISCNKDGQVIIDPPIAAECVLYMLKQCSIGSHIVEYDWAVHTSNYWVCDGIIALMDSDKAWQVGDVLQREMRLLGINNRLNIESKIMSSSHLVRSTENMPYWISTATCGFVPSPFGVMPDNMFHHSHRLCVLKLSRCTFSFSSPPFLCCHSLRLLWLEHCQDRLTRSTTDHHHTDADKQKEDLDNITTWSWACFQSLWVLDLRYTDCDQILSARVMDLMTQLRVLNVMGAKNWDMSHLRGRLRDIRKLRVTNCTCFFENNVFSEMQNMELLDFSGNTINEGMVRRLSGEASSSSLKTVIIEGCDGLKNVSFRGCKELKNMLLKGSFDSLEELDLSSTKVKTLDLGRVESKLPKRIILLGCEKLRAILWPESVKVERWCGVLQIDTTSTSLSTEGGEASHADRSLQQQKEENFKDGWKIFLTDARLLRSMYPIRSYLSTSMLHIDIYSPAILGCTSVQGANSDKPHTSRIMDSEYRDVVKYGPVEEMMMWECPQIPWRNTKIWWSTERTCIIKVIMRGQANKLLEDGTSASTSALLFPGLVFEEATSLHVYDNSAITSIPAPPSGSRWDSPLWCRVERCPKLITVFTIPQGSKKSIFVRLQTLWVSQLLKACYILDMPYNYFKNLRFLHLDRCPRLVHVLQFDEKTVTLDALETLEIVYCGDLKEVFPVDPDLQLQDQIIELPSLRRIHLHELSTLQHICRVRTRAPKLETIKIRGCWSLKRLPAVERNTKPPMVDCEKEWWDNLEWDGLENYYHPSLYQPSHSLYYKTQLLRVSVLM